MKKIILCLLIAFAGISNSIAQQAEIFSINGKAIRGYDPVAFFTLGKAEKGLEEIAYNWNNTTWLFSTKENREAFKTNPEKYSPQYGGYCAYGTSDGHKAPTETDTWTIVNGKLYFNYNQKVKSLWTKNQEALIIKADGIWPGIKDKE